MRVSFWLKHTHACSFLIAFGRIPLRYEAKLLLAAWLVLPHFRGASFIYDRFVREQLRKNGVSLRGHHHGHAADHVPHVFQVCVCACVCVRAAPLLRIASIAHADAG
jgi:hypothetical protein